MKLRTHDLMVVAFRAALRTGQLNLGCAYEIRVGKCTPEYDGEIVEFNVKVRNDLTAP